MCNTCQTLMSNSLDTPKVNRKECWTARDDYFVCFNKNDRDESKCKLELEEFELKCPPSWVKHFKLQDFRPPLKKYNN